ncbi:fungal-specific transcription factor domain-containing protein [Calycina marina]|uniref:Fungal-specific transcription factor domain-containing protein n=1 Tax=Calycina marina TaxID=1763456 RepID=A0A9P8CG80_9HELO|nr:fungal-specific transcription factor domain-containing protein [Calycina marina]
MEVQEIYRTRLDMTQDPRREQLPPLSSIFGSSPLQNAPATSAYAEGQNPIFPAPAPRDIRRPGTPSRSDRCHDASYFQRPSSHHPYGVRPEPVERTGIRSPTRFNSFAPRPGSPRADGRHGLPDAARPHVHAATTWGTRDNHLDLFTRDTSSSFRTHSENRPFPPVSGQNEEPRPYRENQVLMTPTYTPSSVSSSAADDQSAKDTLGPKIWTGTQLLPRFVRQAEVPGEGVCFFYDDGTHCKTVIDGEIVNAHWGVTKAGKPRKRLAIACITCREKKIKCDPDFPRCVQCEKFGRICKFKNAPRGGQGSPDIKPAEGDDASTRPVSPRAEEETFKLDKGEGSQSTSPGIVLSGASPDRESYPRQSKRQRTGYDDFTPIDSEASPRPMVYEATRIPKPWNQVSSSIDHYALREWQVNPYTTAPALVTDLVNIFFTHVPTTASYMFPEGPFKSWVLSTREKSLDDLMLIYSVLGLAAIASPKAEHKALGVEYAAISRYACGLELASPRHFSIQLVQSRLLLALYYFADNNNNDFWDYCGSAIRAASGVRLNVEFDKSSEASIKVFAYGLNRAGYSEMRRRTFFSCYLMDRYNGFCNGLVSFIHSEDVFLKLPSDRKSFELQRETQNAYFASATPVIQDNQWTLSPMAYLINISTIWGDVVANIYRTAERCSSTSYVPFAFATFYENAMQRLHDWKSSLPSCHQFSESSLQQATEEGTLGTFMTMHCIYHNTAMKLNRYILKSTLTPFQLEHHHRIARQHAEDVLVMMDTLATQPLLDATSPSHNLSVSGKLSSPMVGFTVVSAVDILSASFRRESIANRLVSFGSAQSVMTELAKFWRNCQEHCALILQRSADMEDIMRGPHTSDICELRSPLETMFDRRYDSLYNSQAPDYKSSIIACFQIPHHIESGRSLQKGLSRSNIGAGNDVRSH